MNSNSLAAIEHFIANLSTQEQLYLMEFIVKQLQEKNQATAKISDFAYMKSQFESLARDPEMNPDE
jgi:hypothetical protein